MMRHEAENTNTPITLLDVIGVTDTDQVSESAASLRSRNLRSNWANTSIMVCSTKVGLLIRRYLFNSLLTNVYAICTSTPFKTNAKILLLLSIFSSYVRGTLAPLTKGGGLMGPNQGAYYNLI